MSPLKQSPPVFSVRFANLQRQAVALEGETVLQCARREKVPLAGPCGGRGSCGNCLIRVVSGDFTTINRDASGEPEGQETAWRRACLVLPQSDLVVEVSPRCSPLSPRGDRPEVEEDAPPFESAPVIRFTAAGRRALGLAVDLGTTNIAGSLTDLASGERLATLGLPNAQAAYGADLISRINHAVRSNDGAGELQRCAQEALQSLAAALCGEVSAPVEEIGDVVVAGNTAMHHLLLGLPVSQLGRAPFAAACCDPVDLPASELGLQAMPGCSAHLLPNVGGFVGGDHVAALLATEGIWEKGTSLLIDVGTNTEISLIHEGSISTLSTASGPALEGGNISCGMRAAEGAIEMVSFDGGEIVTRTIGGKEAAGLCGSGVLSAVSALHRAGIVDRRGYIRPGDPRVITDGAGLQQFSFAPGVSLTQNDVRAVLLAKAAIRSGTDLLLQEAGVDEGMVEKVLIAGAFGAYIDLESAIGIGLFPPLPRERFRQIGNAAGTGVRLALASVSLRARAAVLAKLCRHLEPNKLPLFQKHFISRIAI